MRVKPGFTRKNQYAMIHIKRSITFSVEKRKKDGKLIEDNAPIRCIVTYLNNRIVLYTGYRIDLKKFVDLKGYVKNNCTNKKGETASDINYAIDCMRSDLQDIFKSYEIKGSIPTPTEIKNEYKIKIGKPAPSKEEPKNIFYYYNEFLVTQRQINAWTNNTYLKQQTTERLLKEFKEELSFEDITEETLQQFLRFLQQKKNQRNTTSAKYIRILKQFLRWAEKKGYTNNAAYREYSPKLKGSQFELNKVIYLTWEELMHIYSLKIDKNYLSRVRDVFCFCCFTGLRYSDVYRLNKTDIRNNKIEIVTQKDTEAITIELNEYSKSIINKYKSWNSPKLLPVIANQKYNEYLKELGKLAKLEEEITEVWFKGGTRKEAIFKKWEKLTSHVARKTFAVNAISLGISQQVVMRWMGHSSAKTMKPYIAIIDKLKEAEMSKFDEVYKSTIKEEE